VPRIKTIAVLDLTDNSYGNAIGVGHADLIAQRLRGKIDRAATELNCLTSHNLAGGKIPITLATDREVISAGLTGIPAEQARVLFIGNTLDLELMWASTTLLPDVAASPALTATGPGQPLPLTAGGELDWSALP
jgi:hypothetical protein